MAAAVRARRRCRTRAVGKTNPNGHGGQRHEQVACSTVGAGVTALTEADGTVLIDVAVNSEYLNPASRDIASHLG
jgi:hypothetical protein